MGIFRPEYTPIWTLSEPVLGTKPEKIAGKTSFPLR
jgi:hypothetical protein